MKRIDRLISKVKDMVSDVYKGLFYDDNDGFIEALGTDKKEYEYTLPDGSKVYDFMHAIEDIKVEWTENEI